MTRAGVITAAVLVIAGRAGAAHAEAPTSHAPRTPEAKPRAVSGTTTLQLTPPAGKFTTLVVENPLGDVRIVGHDQPGVTLEAVKHGPSDGALDRLRVSLVPGADGTLRIGTAVDRDRESPPLARGAVRIDLVIHAPRDVKIDGRVVAGDLEVQDMDAGSELDAASGRISVRNVSGPVVVRSLSGALELAEVFGSVDAWAVSSPLRLDSVSGDKLVASMHKGSVPGRRIRSRVIHISSTEGRIGLEVEAAMASQIYVASVHGDIALTVRHHHGVVITMRGAKLTVPGFRRDDAAMPHRDDEGWVRTQIGAGDPSAKIELSSRYGTVELVSVR